MSLLSPLYLLGALAIALPVIFHLIRRRTRRHMPFSSLMFLRRPSPRLSERSRLEDLLLLAMRVSVLALLAIGFARPFRTGGAALGGATPSATRTVLVVDTSASMRRSDLWSQAQKRVAERVASSGPGDQVAVLTFDRRPRPLFRFEDGSALVPAERSLAIRQGLAAIQPGWGGSRLDQALMLAAEWVTDDENEEAGRREIVILSDLQRGSELSALQTFEWPERVVTRVDVLEPAVPGNAGLQLVADRRSLDGGLEPGLRVRISNTPDAGRDQFRVRWARPDGGPAGDPVEAYVPPGQSRVFAVPLPAVGGDVDRIRLEGDDADFDNTLYVAPPQPTTLRVLYLGMEADAGAGAPLFFLQRAFPETPLLSVEIEVFHPGREVTAEALERAALIVATAPLDDVSAGVVHAAAAAGRTLLFAPRDAEGMATLSTLAGAGPVVATEVTPADFALLGAINFQHPVFLPFATPAYSDFAGIHFWRYRRILEEDLPSAQVLARFDSDDPALVEIPVGKGRVMVLTSCWHPRDSQLALSSKFVPLLYSMLDVAEGGLVLTSQYKVGDRISLPKDMGTSAILTLPDGTEAGLLEGGDTDVRMERPGLYTMSGGHTHMQVAANIPASETHTEPLPIDELAQLGVPFEVAPGEAAPNEKQQALQTATELEARQRWWRWLVAAALAAVILETALAGRTARRTPVAEGVTA